MADPSKTPVSGKPTYAMILRGHIAGSVDDAVSISSPPSLQQSTTASPKATHVLPLRPLIRESLEDVEGTEQGLESKFNEADIQGRRDSELGASVVAEIRATPPEEHPNLPPGLEAHIPVPKPGLSPATLPFNPTSKVTPSPRSEPPEPGKINLLPLEYDPAFVEKAYLKFGAKKLEQKQFVDYLYSQACGLPVPWPGSSKKTEGTPCQPSTSTPSSPYPERQQSSSTAELSQGQQSGTGPNSLAIAGASTFYKNPLVRGNGMQQPYQSSLPRFGISQPGIVHKNNQLQPNAHANPYPTPQTLRPPPYSSWPQLPEASSYAPRPQGGTGIHLQQDVHWQPFTNVGTQQQLPHYMPTPPNPHIHPQSSRRVPKHHNRAHQVTPGGGTGP